LLGKVECARKARTRMGQRLKTAFKALSIRASEALDSVLSELFGGRRK
jgi:hypothetical protein